MEEEKDLEQIVHIALKKCAEWFNPDTEGFYELSTMYREDLQKLYNALFYFDEKYGYENNL